MAVTSLTWIDYVVLGVFLLASLGIGLYHSLTGGRQSTTQEFLMGNRKLGVVPTAISLFVSFQSAIAVLGSTAEMYQFGAQYMVWEPIALCLATLLTERLFVPWIYPLKLVSINDYLERRYESKAVRILGAVVGVLDGVIYMGIAMYAPSAALESATGLPLTVSIPLMAVISISYTTMGGMKAVIWTDVLQFSIFLTGVITIFVKGLLVMGGYGNVLDICDSEGRLKLANWSINPTVRLTVWGFLFGRTIAWMGFSGLTQAAVQRYSATESLSRARLVLLLNIPAIALLYFLLCSNGLTVFAYFSSIQCDPIVNKDVNNPNQLLSLFVLTMFASWYGFAGLFLATLYGGALSTVSSYLSGSAAMLWDDILKMKFSGLAERRKVVLNRLLVIIIGAAATGMAFFAAVLPGPVSQISTAYGNAVFGPIYGIFLMGGLSKNANWKGALIGGVGSLGINLWVVIGALVLDSPLPTLPPTSTEGCTVGNVTWWYNSRSTPSNILESTQPFLTNYTTSSSSPEKGVTGIENFYALSYMWYSLFGILNTLIIGMPASFILRDRDAESRVSTELLLPFSQILSWSSSTSTNSFSETDFNLESDIKEPIVVDCISVKKSSP